MVCRRVDHVLVCHHHKDRELGPDWMDLYDPHHVKMRTGDQGGGLEQQNDQSHAALQQGKSNDQEMLCHALA